MQQEIDKGRIEQHNTSGNNVAGNYYYATAAGSSTATINVNPDPAPLLETIRMQAETIERMAETIARQVEKIAQLKAQLKK